MIKEIGYKGITAAPSDYECSDGDIAGMLNMVPENGVLKPVAPPQKVLELSEEEAVVYIHETANYKHYITKKQDNSLLWIDDEATNLQSVMLKQFDGGIELYQVNAIGNTLIVQCSTGMFYFLWKDNAQGYLSLGTHIPECPISFGLQGEMVRTDEFTISFNSIGENNLWDEFSDDNKKKITEQVLAKVNKFIAEKSTDAGKFLYPFFVRYAYRLYDGSLTMHSSPILMICSSDLAPQVAWSHISGGGSYNHATLRIMAVLHQLDYAVILPGRIDELKRWGDIVKSVDVFISKPIYTYDQNGECTRFRNVNDSDSYSVCLHTNSAANVSQYPKRYQKHKLSEMQAFTWDPTNFTYSSARLILPERSEGDIKADIRDCNAFYLLESIKVDNLKTERTILSVKKDYLRSLVAREVMDDDYDSHDTLISKYSFAYNQRINVTGIRKRLFDAFNMGAMICYSDGCVHHYNDSPPTIIDRTYRCYAFFFIRQGGKEIVVQGEMYTFGIKAPILFLYYPNVNCYKAVIVKYDGIPSYFEVNMEKHGFLNGSFYFGGWEDLSKQVQNPPTESTAEDATVELLNKIYTSDVNNPFRFSVTNINTVGTGKIIGISTAAKALSEGQFGKFPLYAFTTEGVWAMEVSSSGAYSAKQPITRDTCINANSITQIDSSVLFATDRGVMMLSGSESVCISEILNSDKSFNPLILQSGEEFINQAGFNKNQFKYSSFKNYLKKGGMLYDYTHQRIIVYNPDHAYAYVYSLGDKAWGMIESDIAHGVNAYPEALSTTSQGTLVNYSEYSLEDIQNGIKCALFTRPLKLEMHDVLKTIDVVIQRGYFANVNIKQVLYGSRDLRNWFLVWSSSDSYMRGFRGTPYKYFRLAVMGNFNIDESLRGCTVEFTPRYINQPR